MPNVTKLRSTIAGLIGLLAVLGPKLLDMLGTPTNKWATLGVQALGAIVLACTTGRAVALLNKFIPEEENARDPQRGSATIEQLIDLALPLLAAGIAALGFWALLTLMPGSARADGLTLPLTDTWTCSPVGALTGMQYNVKTGDFQRGVGLGAGYGCRYTGWKVPLSIEAVGGFAANTNAPNAAQGSLVFVISDNYGVGPGAQLFKDPSTGNITGQLLISGFLTGSWASTIDQLNRAKAIAAEQARAGR